MIGRGLLATGKYRHPTGALSNAITILSVFLVSFGIYSNLVGSIDAYISSSIFLCAMLSITLLLYTPTKYSKALKPSWIDYLLSSLSLATGVYIYSQSERLLTRWATVEPLNYADWFFGIVIILLAVEVTRRVLGAGLTIVLVAFILYAIAGHLLPGQLYHRPISLEYYVDSIAFTLNGTMGSTTYVAATYVFMFVMFGVFLDKANGGKLFSNLANAIAGSQTGGPAKVAVISSGLYGTISGSPTADVMTTGSVTIPLMKKMGFDPADAGAVEAVASTGGSILPPVMGSAAFLMVQLTGTPYRDLAVAAFLPALLYYLGVFMQVHYSSARFGFGGLPKDQLPRLRDALKESGEFIIPFVVLIYLLLSGFAPAYTAIAGTLTTVAVSWLRKENRIGWRKILESIVILLKRLAPITGACAAAGLVIGGINITGFSGRMITLVNAIAGDSTFIAMVIAAVVCIILGMGMPVSSVYILVAVLIGPALMEHGLSLMAAHLFLIYFSALSAVTPPVAVAAYSAASIADANPIKIAWTAVRLGIAAYLVPFIFSFDGALMMEGSLDSIIWGLFAAGIAVIMLGAAVEGYFLSILNRGERVAIVAASIGLMSPWLMSRVVGLIGLTFIVVRQLNQRRKEKEMVAQ